MEKVNELLNFLGTCSSPKKTKNNTAVKNKLEKFSDLLIIIGIGLYSFIFILAAIYYFIYSLEILKFFTLCVEIVALFSFIFGMLFQIVPTIFQIKNFTKESQSQLIKMANNNEKTIKILSKYDKNTLEDSKDHIQLKINNNTSKNHLLVGKNVTIIFLLGSIYSFNNNQFNLITFFSKIYNHNYSFWEFIAWALFSIILGFYLGAFTLSIENRRLNIYIDLINIALKRQQRLS